jgi:hypothetical protein
VRRRAFDKRDWSGNVREKPSSEANEDLSIEIAKAIPRNAREHVTCTRVDPDHYRCNWWLPQSLAGYDNPSMNGLMVTTNRVCRSAFLRVTRSTGGELKIETVTRGSSTK